MVFKGCCLCSYTVPWTSTFGHQRKQDTRTVIVMKNLLKHYSRKVLFLHEGIGSNKYECKEAQFYIREIKRKNKMHMHSSPQQISVSVFMSWHSASDCAEFPYIFVSG